jgi:DNA repair exonuclease SbcCD ATPase subunit
MPATYQGLLTELGRQQRSLAARQGQRDQIAADRTACEARLTATKAQSLTYDLAATVLRKTADYARALAKTQLENLVSAYLQAIYGPSYWFVIDMVERAGRAEAEFFVTSGFGPDGGLLKTRIESSRGGGVADIVSLALREAMLETYRPQLEGALVLDEPLKMLSAEFVQPAVQLLTAIGQRYGRQQIMVTHDGYLAQSGAAHFQVTQPDGCTSLVTRIA